MLPTIETDRLLLRVPVQSDFDGGWAEFHEDPECMRYLGGAMPRSLAWRALAQVVGMWSLRGFGQFSAIEKSSGRWVGRIGLWEPEGWPAQEIGWMLHRSAWGKGYATEGAAACLRYAFEDLKWLKVAHMIDPENAGSQTVAARLGSQLLGSVILPAPFGTGAIQMWGQTVDEWRSKVERDREN